jgi:hypothetical protein
MAQTPQYGDSEHNLLLKIADNFGVVANSGDSKNSILYKIANRTYQSAINPPSPSYDPDALAYVQASGATDIDNINAFVVGVKALGLWNTMVCWPLRSSQNAGTGSTAYSLGGLGTYNGTLVNGPTWGVDGITTNGVAQYINATIGSANLRTYSIIYIQKIISDGGNWWAYGGASNGGNGNFSINVSSTGGRGLGVTQPNVNIANNATSNGSDFYEVAFSGGATSFSAWTIGGNNSEISGNWLFTSGTPNILNIGLSFNNINIPYGPLNAQFSVAVIFDISLSKAQHDSVNSLYKSTLGQGLGLP